MIKLILSWLTNIAFLLVLLIPNISFSAQDSRTALVIGNGSYQSSPLRNPVSDAKDMAEVLRNLGFSVTLKTDANLRDMKKSIKDFGRNLRMGGVGLFYYAGHGMQVNGRNYLVPIGADVNTESEVEYEAVDAGRILGQMEDAGNGLNIIILDACRDNPFAKSFRSSEKGLAKMDAPTGSFLAYATAPGSVAADGTGRNGLYTSKLLKHMVTPGLELEKLFKYVRIEVANASRKTQVPWESSSLMGDFFFNPKRGITVQSVTSKLAMSKRPPKKLPRSLTNSMGMEFVYIQPGTFMMGSPTNEPDRRDNENQYRVTLTQGFYMQTTEVTQGQWKAIMGSNPSKFKNCGVDCPVEKVSWNDVQSFINKLNQREGSGIYRLPTEAEWEYAARAGSKTAFANGDISETECGYDSNLDAIGWYCGNASKTHPVAQKQPNAWGLYDMHGNIFEWCQDRLGNYPSGSAIDPTGPSGGSRRVLRGGSYGFYTWVCRSAFRGEGEDPGDRSKHTGFRLLRNPSSEIETVPTPSLQEIGRDGRFVAYDNGTVKDTKTGLMWASKDNGEDINWKDAKQYCGNYRGGGYTDWRMPTIDELAGLYDKNMSGYNQGYGPQLDKVKLTKLIHITYCCLYASDTRGSRAAYFDFDIGRLDWGYQWGSYVRALPVRGGN